MLFHNKFNKFNNTGAFMLDSIYHINNTKSTLKSHFFRENTKILSDIQGIIMSIISELYVIH